MAYRVRRVRARQLVFVPSGRAPPKPQTEQHAVPGVWPRPAENGGGAARRRGPRRPAPAAPRQAARPPAAPAQGAAPEVPARPRAAQGLLRGHGEGAHRRRGGGGGAREGEVKEDGRGRDRRDGGARARAGGRAGGGGRRRAAVQRAPLHPLIDSRASTRSCPVAIVQFSLRAPALPSLSFVL
ncbi:hypothetical protein PVAP13_2KG347905 [Panicum virgatum]|uniref:Uncharacterized protein n=1 Tax=Panicum virgatum TaxID=38727 RepID=A0A8T0W934_PANVG|nr:hypothetical protein PVAP13_2KG347905 [Panicum virgatum]